MANKAIPTGIQTTAALAALTPQTLQRRFSAVYGRGLQLHRAGAVALDRVDDERAHGRIKDDLAQPFRTRVALIDGGDGVALDNDCSCELGRDCEHVVALALAWGQARSRPAPPSARPPRDAEPGARVSKPSPPCPWSAWADRVVAASATAPAEPPAASGRDDEQIRYLFALDDERPLIRPVRTRALKTGRAGGMKPIDLDSDQALERISRVAPADRALLIALKFAARAYRGHEPWLDLSTLPDDVLDDLVASGRCHLEDANGPVLAGGEPRALALAWRVDDDGAQTLLPELGGARALGVSWSRYLDPETHRIGRIERGSYAACLDAIRSAPPIQPDYRAEALAAIARAGLGDVLPRPRALDLVVRRVEARALVTLDRPLDDRSGGAQLPQGIAAMLEFRYGGLSIAANDERDELREFDGKRVIEMPRDGAFETACVEFLEHVGLKRADAPAGSGIEHPPAHWRRAQPLNPEQVRRFVDNLTTQAPVFRIDVYASERFPLFVGPTLDAPTVELREIESGWFDVQIGIEVDGARVDLYALLDALERGALKREAKGLIVPLANGRTALFPRERLDALLVLVKEIDTADGKRAVPRERLPALLPPPDWRLVLDDAADRFLTDVAQFDGLSPLDPPPDFQATLRPYQARGVAWLDFLRRFGFGGVLADEMGLGKTVQVLAFLAREHAEGRLTRPALVVCPTSVAPNWRAEALRFAPMLRTQKLARGDRSDVLRTLDAQHLVITNYSLLLRDIDELERQRWSMLVLDEAQWLKNSASQGFRAASLLRADLAVALSGTPVENHLGELKALFDLVMPGLLGADAAFAERFRTPIERDQDHAASAGLKRRIRPFLLRRTKSEVAAELPPRTIITRPVEFGEAQRELYETIRASMEIRVRDILAARGAATGLKVLDALLKLRQVCCDPALIAGVDPATGSAKREALDEFLPMLIEEGRGVLLFSQFTSMLDLIERDVIARGIRYARLDGATADRAKPVQRFQSGEVPLLLVSLKAGGVGLNLTRADTVILYDPWWNPAAEAQAIDRAHRIGQDKPLFVYELVASNTVEEKMQALKARKRAIAEAVIEAGDASLSTLGANELLALLAR